MFFLLSSIFKDDSDSYEQQIERTKKTNTKGKKLPRTASSKGGGITCSLNESKNKILWIFKFVNKPPNKYMY